MRKNESLWNSRMAQRRWYRTLIRTDRPPSGYPDDSLLRTPAGATVPDRPTQFSSQGASHALTSRCTILHSIFDWPGITRSQVLRQKRTLRSSSQSFANVRCSIRTNIICLGTQQTFSSTNTQDMKISVERARQTGCERAWICASPTFRKHLRRQSRLNHIPIGTQAREKKRREQATCIGDLSLLLDYARASAL